MSRKKDQLYNPDADGQPSVKTCPLCGPVDQPAKLDAPYFEQLIWAAGKLDRHLATVARCRSCNRLTRVIVVEAPDLLTERQAWAIAAADKLYVAPILVNVVANTKRTEE